MCTGSVSNLFLYSMQQFKTVDLNHVSWVTGDISKFLYIHFWPDTDWKYLGIAM